MRDGLCLDAIDWDTIARDLDIVGYAVTAPFLPPSARATLVDMYSAPPQRFRSIIDMAAIDRSPS